MAERSDGPRTHVRSEKARIDWGARRRQVSALLRDPPQRVWWGMDDAELMDAISEALYLAEAAAERVPHPELLRQLLLAKGAAHELWKRRVGYEAA